MNLAYKNILGKFTKVLGFGKTPPPCWEKFPNNIIFLWERTLGISTFFQPFFSFVQNAFWYYFKRLLKICFQWLPPSAKICDGNIPSFRSRPDRRWDLYLITACLTSVRSLSGRQNLCKCTSKQIPSLELQNWYQTTAKRGPWKIFFATEFS